MKRSINIILSCFFVTIFHIVGGAQNYKNYAKTEASISMRDGVKLFTTIYKPVGMKGKLPIIMLRTPYGATSKDTVNFSTKAYYSALAPEGYIFVFQDIRGKFRSEGKMEMNKPLYHLTNAKTVDESTDCYDSANWCVKINRCIS